MMTKYDYMEEDLFIRAINKATTMAAPGWLAKSVEDQRMGDVRLDVQVSVPVRNTKTSVD